MEPLDAEQVEQLTKQEQLSPTYLRSAYPKHWIFADNEKDVEKNDSDDRERKQKRLVSLSHLIIVEARRSLRPHVPELFRSAGV